MKTKNLLTGIALFSTLAGCKSIGPSVIENTHPSYNNAVIDSMDRELLMNLVRLKYRENPMFLEISSITESRSLGADFGLSKDTNKNMISPTFEVGVKQTPTISYKPVRGQEFIKQLMTPIPLSAILVMSHSGWNVRRAFNLCVEQINDLDNAHTASGPTPAIKPNYRDFYRMTDLLQKLEDNDQIVLGIEPTNRSSLVMCFKNADQNKEALDEFKDMLGLSKLRNEFHFQDNFLTVNEGDAMTVRTRSLMGVLFYLSHGVEAPQADIASGVVSITKDNEGAIFDWKSDEFSEMLKVHSSDKKPEGEFLSVFHRGHWFYIEDNDLRSKSTFMFLSYLFNLQSGGDSAGQSVAPMLTIPVVR